jgi:hypothetical protein
MRSGWIVLLVIAVGCGEVGSHPDGSTTGPTDAGPDPNEGATSGTRLKLKWIDFAGTRSADGIFDAQRNESCFLTPWADGKVYCVPSGTASVVYSNSGCTAKVGLVYRQASCTSVTPPTYLLEYSAQACQNAASHLYQRGAKVAVSQYFEKYTDGTCGGPYTTTSYDFYALGAEVPTTELAPATIGSPMGTGRLAQRYYESADGLKTPYRVHDALLGIDCYASSSGGGATSARCIPEDAAYIGNFHDAACSQMSASNEAACPAPKFAVKYGSCPYDTPAYYPVAAAQTVPPLYYDSGTSCVSTTPSTATKYYGTGQLLQLATPARAPDQTGKRIEKIHLTTPDGLSARDYALYDTQKTTECYPAQSSDGSVHCLPSGGGAQTLYTDASCANAVQIMTVYRGAATCSPPPLPSYSLTYKLTPSCTYDVEARPVGALHTAAVYEKYSDNTCHAFPSASYVLYDVGAPIAADQFASGTAITDP